MDLTHETYVHASSIGQKEIDESPVQTKVEGDKVFVAVIWRILWHRHFGELLWREMGLHRIH